MRQAYHGGVGSEPKRPPFLLDQNAIQTERRRDAQATQEPARGPSRWRCFLPCSSLAASTDGGTDRRLGNCQQGAEGTLAALLVSLKVSFCPGLHT